jgi:hypothetical protein
MGRNDSTNRYSMPVTRSRSYNIAELNLDSSLDGNNTTGFLFGDEDAANSDSKTYQQASNADNFPTLVRNAGFPTMVSPEYVPACLLVRIPGRDHLLGRQPSCTHL